jgi:SAM-dependent methyltransferase
MLKNSVFPKMDHWVYLPHGRYLLEAERKALAALLPRYFGYHLVQLGGPLHFDLLESSLINHHIRLTDDVASGFAGSSVEADFDSLPFLPDSIDLVVMPHTLDRLQHPQAMLKGIYDVLIPEGHVIILGYNAWSLWRLAKILRPHDALLHSAQFHGAWQVRRWLNQAGFQIVYHKSVAHRPPVPNEEWLKRLLFLEPAGQLLWPHLGAVHLIVAKKRVLPFTAIRAPIRKKVVHVGEHIAEPSHLNPHQLVNPDHGNPVD